MLGRLKLIFGRVKMLHKTVCMILGAMALGFGPALPAQTFISFDVPAAKSTLPSGINAAGAVVGWYVDSAGATHGFLLKDGNYTTIDYPGAVVTQPRAINSQGDIVGCHSEDATRIPGGIGCHGFLLQNGTFTPLDYPGKYGLIPARINDAGHVVGCNHDDDGPGGTMKDDMHGFLYSGGNYTQLSTQMTMNYAINADGSVIAGIVGGAHGYLASNDKLAIFDFPFATLTNPEDMTPAGDVIVGGYIDAANATHGFLLRLGDSLPTFGLNGPTGMPGPFEFTTIDYPGAAKTVAYGINPQGEVVGYYVDTTGKTHGFFRSPVRRHSPEEGMPER